MKTKRILSLLLLFSTFSCQAMILKKLIVTTLIPSSSYLSYKLYQADGDFNKMQRFIRQDKNTVCTQSITHLQTTCKSDNLICQETIRCFENARSPLTQIVTDDALQALDDVTQVFDDSRNALRENQTYKDTKDAYCKMSEELKKSKKD